MWFTYVLADEVGQFVGVLTRCWYTHRARPVVVQVAHFVGQTLALVWCHVAVIVNDDVVSWRHCSLVNFLRGD